MGVPAMRFKFLLMKDFRGIRELRIDFEPSITVIIGRNGSGKTSILDALGELARLFRSQLKGRRRGGMNPQLTSRDVRLGTSGFELGLMFDFEDEWSSSNGGNALEIRYNVHADQPNNIYSDRLRGWSDTVELQPRFIHYRQNRGFETNARRSTPKLDQSFDAEAVQDLSLSEDLQAIRDLEAWWDDRDAQEARTVRDIDPKYRDPQLEAIRKLVTKIGNFTGISFLSTTLPPGLHLTKDDNTTIHVNSLSGGERSYIILLADLARRLQVFAPDRPLKAIPAIVLIDEIELNLHPAWQSEIAPVLTSVFKACQFIVTTHSPQVISGMGSQNVRILHQESSGNTSVTIPLSTKGRTSNYLLDGVFYSSERYPPINRLVDDFNIAIDRGDAATAETKLANIEEEIEDDIPTLLVLRKRLRSLRNTK